MANVIKYIYTSVPENTVRVYPFVIGVNFGGYGSTAATGYWNGKTPNVGGYVVYVSVNPPSSPTIYVADNDTQLINLCNQFFGAGVSTIGAALQTFNNSTTTCCVNVDYSNIVTSGLILNLDASYTPSYPRIGAAWNDISGGLNNGTLVNGPTYSSTDGGSIVFNGSNNYVSILNNTTVSFTIDCWVNTTATSYTGTQGYEGNGIVWSDVAGVANDFVLSILNNKASWFTGDNTTTINSTTTINTGAWFYITVVKNGTNSTKELFINGVSESTGTSGTSTLTANPNISIGGNTLDSRYFNGKISQVKIYNKVLSSSEILQNYYAGLQRLIPTNGLVLYLDGNNTNKQVATPTIANDISGNNYNGAIMNTVSLSRDGQRSFSFDGVDDYVTVGSFFTYQSFTINLWVKPGSFQTTYADIIDNNHTGNQNWVCQQNVDNLNQYQFIVFGSSGQNSTTGFFTLTSNVWVNLTFTYDGDKVRGYINNSLNGTGASLGTTINYVSPFFNIGRWSGGGRNLNGNIGHIRVYNRVLTDAEITTIYTATKSRYGY